MTKLQESLAADYDDLAPTTHLQEDENPFATMMASFDQAAEKLGLDPDRVFKTLLATVDGALAVGIVPVAMQLDLKALAHALGGKRAEMADPSLAERKTGYVVGGISPIGQKTPLPTVLDESAILCETIYVSGGRRGLDLELAPDDLLDVTSGRYAPIARTR